MSNPLAARIPAEPGWRVVCFSAAAPGFTYHAVYGWGLVPTKDAQTAGKSLQMNVLPLSLSGEVMSDKPNYLCVVSPDDDVEEALKLMRPLLALAAPFVPGAVTSPQDEKGGR